ncbi:glutamine synthetase, catalytic domain-containing protein [Pochonia chlamydosporia 170]|uniref:Glutamine synthetase, catalytic domain-containing protein n=1 Tax=Pochonia chlamydosporia 170 TaxID=1380566 RepID=A0A179FVV0_METCM|nr:glutamine synthetase, catalytic domain-containing protein [Pochonia chlamydosporia 170]OAQ69251.1 glutamine synthetase, catalytic domain-containing protein [Pochonia chlamydosporia 170]
MPTDINFPPRVEYFRLQWIDYSGVLRVRIVSRSVALDLAKNKQSYTLAQNCLIIPISTAPACFPDGIEEWLLIPDWKSLRVCGFKNNYASVMCGTSRAGFVASSARCPRSRLCDVLSEFGSTHSYSIMLGFEIEFSFLDQGFNIVACLDQGIGYSTSTGLRGEMGNILDEIVSALKVSGIEIYHFHVEMADQYEIALSPLPPMEAIDALIMTQETIRTIAIRHGLRAQLSPKPVGGGRGPKNGLHAHLSLNPAQGNENHFLAGILRKVRSLCAFGLANYDSYERVAGDCAGEWVAYGSGNKDLPIRQVNHHRWEIRFLDATANVYLFMAAIISAGMEGLLSQRHLAMEDCQVVPSALSFEEAKRQLGEKGITERTPKSLKESIDAVTEDKEMKDWVGEELLTHYVRVKQKEVEHFGKMGEDERRIKMLQYF